MRIYLYRPSQWTKMTFSLGIYFTCSFFHFIDGKVGQKSPKKKTKKLETEKWKVKWRAKERITCVGMRVNEVNGGGVYAKSPMRFEKCQAYNLAADSCTLSLSRRKVIAWLNVGHAADICVLSATECIEKRKVLLDFYFAVFRYLIVFAVFACILLHT